MDIYQTIAEMRARGERGTLCTIVSDRGSVPRHTSSKMLVFEDGHIAGTIGGGDMENRAIQEALEVMDSGQPRLVQYDYVDPSRGDVGVCGGQIEVFMEPVINTAQLVVIGGGHVGKAVSHLAKWLGFRVLVSDDRPEFCTPEFHPDADAFYPVPLAELPNHIRITPQTYLVLTTRGMVVDIEGLPALLDTPAPYIGVIGSKRRWALARKKMIDAGVPEEKLRRVRSPIGLELNAETPEEIAVSILAEVLMVRNQGTGQPMTMTPAANTGT